MKQIGQMLSGAIPEEQSRAFEGPKYWWVNHRQTHRQEIDGGYLWSPKTEKNQVRSQFYDNMRLASPGDFVFSYANGRISHIGRVQDYASAAKKPDEFGRAGDVWADEGWLLPIDWMPLLHPVIPKAILADISMHLPNKYSPIHSQTGNGNQKAYLAQIDISLFDIIKKVSGFTSFAHSIAATTYSLQQNPLRESVESQLESDVQRDTSLAASQIEQVIKARKGQGQFRLNVFAIESCCRLTSIARPEFLVASHIKPWRCCINSIERLDGNNGLLLTPNADLLFDRGFISFSDDGKILVSRGIELEELRRLGLSQALERNVGAFSAQQSIYLTYHRENIFVY